MTRIPALPRGTDIPGCRLLPLGLLALPLLLATSGTTRPAEMEPVRVAPDGKGFVLVNSGVSPRPFHPWGLNYGNKGRLIEDFWETEWPTVERDFREMKSLGANVVRVHLQLGKFMSAADRPND